MPTYYITTGRMNSCTANVSVDSGSGQGQLYAFCGRSAPRAGDASWGTAKDTEPESTRATKALQGKCTCTGGCWWEAAFSSRGGFIAKVTTRGWKAG